MRFVVPIDFSANSENALRYASVLAQAKAAEIKLLHVIHPTTGNAVISGLMAEEIAEEKVSAAVEMKKIIEKLHPAYSDVQYSYEVRVGEASKEIVECAKEFQANIIIMGTRGASGLKKLFFGSNTSAVIERSVCPVMAVPENCDLKFMKKIIFATNYYNSDLNALEELAKIAEVFSAEINILHIIGENEKKESEEEMIRNFLIIVTRAVNYTRISCKILKSSDIAEGLNTLFQTEKADMLALSTRKRSALDKIFNSSLTKELSFHSKVPLLAFQVNETESNNDSN